MLIVEAGGQSQSFSFLKSSRGRHRASLARIKRALPSFPKMKTRSEGGGSSGLVFGIERGGGGGEGKTGGLEAGTSGDKRQKQHRRALEGLQERRIGASLQRPGARRGTLHHHALFMGFARDHVQFARGDGRRGRMRRSQGVYILVSSLAISASASASAVRLSLSVGLSVSPLWRCAVAVVVLSAVRKSSVEVFCTGMFFVARPCEAG